MTLVKCQLFFLNLKIDIHILISFEVIYNNYISDLQSYVTALNQETVLYSKKKVLHNSKLLSGNVNKNRGSSVSMVQDEIRYDGIGHIIKKREKQRRCRMKECSSKPKTFCQKCDATLCISCFPKFHEKLG